MDTRKIVFKQTGIIAAGVCVGVAAMLGIFALLGAFDRTVLFGGLLGGVMTILNFFFMAMTTSLAADRAEAQNVKGGQMLLSGSQLVRYIVLFLVLFAGAKSGYCHPFALVAPLLFVRPTLMVAEFFRKDGEAAR